MNNSCEGPADLYHCLASRLFSLKYKFDEICHELDEIKGGVQPDSDVIKYSGCREELALMIERLNRCLKESIRTKEEINEMAKYSKVLAESYYEPKPYNPNKSTKISVL